MPRKEYRVAHDAESFVIGAIVMAGLMIVYKNNFIAPRKTSMNVLAVDVLHKKNQEQRDVIKNLRKQIGATANQAITQRRRLKELQPPSSVDFF